MIRGIQHTENNSLDSSVRAIKYSIHFILLIIIKRVLCSFIRAIEITHYWLFIGTTLLNCVGVLFPLGFGPYRNRTSPGTQPLEPGIIVFFCCEVDGHSRSIRFQVRRKTWWRPTVWFCIVWYVIDSIHAVIGLDPVDDILQQ